MREIAIKNMDKLTFIDILVSTEEFGFQVYNPIDRILTKFDGDEYTFIQNAKPRLLNLDYQEILARKNPILLVTRHFLSVADREALIELSNAYPNIEICIPTQPALNTLHLVMSLSSQEYVLFWPSVRLYSPINIEQLKLRQEIMKSYENEENATETTTVIEESGDFSPDESEMMPYPSKTPPYPEITDSDEELDRILSPTKQPPKFVNDIDLEDDPVKKKKTNIYDYYENELDPYDTYRNPYLLFKVAYQEGYARSRRTKSTRITDTRMKSSKYYQTNTATVDESSYYEATETKEEEKKIIIYDDDVDEEFLQFYSELIDCYRNTSLLDREKYPWDIFFGDDRHGEEYAHLEVYFEHYKRTGCKGPTFSNDVKINLKRSSDRIEFTNPYDYDFDMMSDYDMMYNYPRYTKSDENYIYPEYLDSNLTINSEQSINVNWFDEYVGKPLKRSKYGWEMSYYHHWHASSWLPGMTDSGNSYKDNYGSRYAHSDNGIFQIIGLSAKRGITNCNFDIVVPKYIKNMREKGRFWRNFNWAVSSSRLKLPWDEYGPGMAKYRQLVLTKDEIKQFRQEDFQYMGMAIRETRERIIREFKDKNDGIFCQFISPTASLISEWLQRIPYGLPLNKLSIDAKQRNNVVRELSSEDFKEFLLSKSDRAVLLYDSSPESARLYRNFSNVAFESKDDREMRNLKFGAINVDFNTPEFTHPNISAPVLINVTIPSVIVIPQVWYRFVPFVCDNEESVDKLRMTYKSRKFYDIPVDFAEKFLKNEKHFPEIIERLSNFTDIKKTVRTPTGQSLYFNDMFHYAPIIARNRNRN